MHEPPSDENRQRMESALEKINQGEPISPVAATWIENIWRVKSQLPPEYREGGIGVDLNAMSGLAPDAEPISPELKVALMIRYALMDALLQVHLLDEWMADESKRKQAFAAAASFACTIGDFAEALALKNLAQAPSPGDEKTTVESREASSNVEPPAVYRKLAAHFLGANNAQ